VPQCLTAGEANAQARIAAERGDVNQPKNTATIGYIRKLECGLMPNLMVALPNTGGALCSTPQSLADAHY